MGGDVEDCIASALAGNPDDHLPGLHNFARAGADGGYDTGRIRFELGETHQVIGGFHLCFSGVDLRCRGLQRLLGLVVIGARGPALFEQGVLAFEMIAGLCQLTLGSNEIGLRRPQGVALVLRFQPRDHLSSLEPIAELSVVLKHAARDPESERHFILRFDASGQGNRHAGFAFLDSRGANRTRFRRGRFRLRRTTRKGHEQRECGRDGQQVASSCLRMVNAHRHGPTLPF